MLQWPSRYILISTAVKLLYIAKLFSEQRSRLLFAGDVWSVAARRHAMHVDWPAPHSDDPSTAVFLPSCPMTASAWRRTMHSLKLSVKPFGTNGRHSIANGVYTYQISHTTELNPFVTISFRPKGYHTLVLVWLYVTLGDDFGHHPTSWWCPEQD